MTTQTHLDVRPSRSRIAAFLLIVGLGVLAVTAQFHSQGRSLQTEAVAEFGD